MRVPMPWSEPVARRAPEDRSDALMKAPRKRERAEKPDSTDVEERAVVVESTVHSERADLSESTVLRERSI